MQLNLDKYKELTFVIGNGKTIEQMMSVVPLKPFDITTIDFLNELSKELMILGKGYPDVITFGFWCRKSNLMQEKSKYDDLILRRGRGIVFHSTPSNVAVNFAFSLVSGLLAGNANIVRLPMKDFEQVNIICQTIRGLLEEKYNHFSPYICMLKYVSVPELNDLFSNICDSRIIWGGDGTIERLRKSPLKARANEITFADRFSIAVINADIYLHSEEKQKVAKDFYNDTYNSDQNACTSPQIIFWIGENKEKAKKEFWANLYTEVKEKYPLSAVQAIGKLDALCKVAVKYKADFIDEGNNYIYRIKIDKLDDEIINYKYNSGFFFEYDINQLKEIIPICFQRCQTLTYFGIEKEDFLQFFEENSPIGIDRIVPIGKSMDFSLVWDGYDLIRSLSRKITVL